jgi:hypothetical protein
LFHFIMSAKNDANDDELNYAHKDVDDGDDDVFAIDEDASSDDEQEKKSEPKKTPILHDFIDLNEAPTGGSSAKGSPVVAAKSSSVAKSTTAPSTPPATPTLSMPTASATSPGDDADADDDDDDKAAAEAAQFDPYRMANAGKKKKKKKESILERLDRLKRDRAREQRVVGNSNVVELEESAEQRLLWLELDVQLFSDPARMAEGVVLQDPLEAFGKVVFSLANIPLNVGFQTERGTSVVRINDDEVVLNGRRVVAVPRDEVVKQREQDAAIADRKRAEDERERLEREQLLAAITERIDFRATVAESKKSKRFIPGYRILVESKRDGSTRTVSKRFDDFLTFHRRLLVKLSLAQQTRLPKFPRRQRLVAGADAIEARRVALDRYLSELLTCDIVLAFEAELREFVMHDGEAWRAAMSDSDKSDNDNDNNDKSLRRKPATKAVAAKSTAPTAEDAANQFLSESDDEVDSTPVVREVRKKRKSTRERVKGHLKRLGSKSSAATDSSGAAATAAAASERAEAVDQAEDVDYLRDGDDGDDDDMDVEGKQTSPRVENKPAAAPAATANVDGDSSGDENGVPLPKVSFGGRTVRKQRKQSETFAHAYVEVRDATGLPPKTQAYVALGVVDVASALGLPTVQASSGGSTTVRLSAVSLEQQSAHPAPGLSKLRAASTTIGKLEADGVAFACEWRESFRVNISDPEGQVLVVSLCAKNMLKDTRLVSVAIPLRATERTWWLAKVAGESGSVSPRGSTRAIEIDGVERWIPLAFPGAPEARVRVVLAFREAVEFSAPREFRHEAHMGFSSDGSFDVHNLPVAWKGFFKSIGIKPRELADPVTAKMVFKIIAKHKEAQQSGEAMTADDLLVDIDFADLRPTGPAPAPPIASLLDGFDPFAPLTPEQAPDPDRVIFVDDESSSEAPVDEKPKAPVVAKKVKTVLDTSSEEEDVVEDDIDDEENAVQEEGDAEDVADAMTDDDNDDEAADDAPASPIKDVDGGDDDDDVVVVSAPPVVAGGPPPPPPPMPKGGAKAKKIATDVDTAAAPKTTESTEKLKRTGPSARDMTMDSIRKGNLKAALKPATERELAPKSQAGAGPVQLGDILKIAMSRRRDALKVDKTGAAVESSASPEAATATSNASTDNGDDNWDDV